MEPLDDKDLNQLLRKWKAPAAPATMRVAAVSSRQSLWRWIWSGRIRVPVPVGAAIVFGALAFWIYSSRTVHAPLTSPVGNATVSTPAPQDSPVPPASTPPVEHISPKVVADENKVTAALSGFRAVGRVEPKIVRVQP